MITNILVGLLVYGLTCTLFLVGWFRWQTRMHRMDEDMSTALAEMRNATPRVVFGDVVGAPHRNKK